MHGLMGSLSNRNLLQMKKKEIKNSSNTQHLHRFSYVPTRVIKKCKKSYDIMDTFRTHINTTVQTLGLTKKDQQKGHATQET